MTLAFDRPLVCPVVVGRAACVEAIDRAIDEAQAGRGSRARHQRFSRRPSRAGARAYSTG